MKTKDKRRVNRYRKAYPVQSTGKSNEACLELIKSIFQGRKQFNKQFSKLVKRA